MIYIYGLIERGERVKGIRYIGLTNNPGSRLSGHLECAEENTKAQWINDVLLKGDTVDMIILDSAETREDARRLEASWIKFAESKGWKLTNSARPNGERLSLPSATDHDYAARLLEFDIEFIGQLRDIRTDIAQLKGVPSAPPIRSEAKPQRKTWSIWRLKGAYRQLVIASIFLIIVNLSPLIERLSGINLDTITFLCFISWAALTVYPLLYLARLSAVWLFGGSPLQKT